MATPVLMTRKDVVLQVEFDPVGAPGVFTNACGITNANFNISNEIIETKSGDCDDWTVAIATLKTYGALSASLSATAQMNQGTHAEMLAWALEQKQLNVRLLYSNATATGHVQMLDGAAKMEGYSFDGIGNVDGNPITEDITLQYDGSPVPTYMP